MPKKTCTERRALTRRMVNPSAARRTRRTAAVEPVSRAFASGLAPRDGEVATCSASPGFADRPSPEVAIVVTVRFSPYVGMKARNHTRKAESSSPLARFDSVMIERLPPDFHSVPGKVVMFRS
jgi:hypothetical protein